MPHTQAESEQCRAATWPSRALDGVDTGSWFTTLITLNTRGTCCETPASRGASGLAQHYIFSAGN